MSHLVMVKGENVTSFEGDGVKMAQLVRVKGARQDGTSCEGE